MIDVKNPPICVQCGRPMRYEKRPGGWVRAACRHCRILAMFVPTQPIDCVAPDGTVNDPIRDRER